MAKTVSIEAKSRTIQSLMDELQTGKYFLPSFQRQYVWDEDDIKDFIDSIINSYPIGAVILWKPSNADTPNEDPLSKPLVDVTDEARHSEAFYVLDGQQRLTTLLLLFQDWSLERAGEQIVREPISYNRANGKLYKSRTKGLNLSTLVRAFCLEERRSLKKIMDAIPEDEFDQVKGTIRSILEYPVPICILETYVEDEDTFRKMAEAFIRVNKSGVRIGNLELMLSFLAGAVSGGLKQRIADSYEEFSDDFGLDLQPIIRLVFSQFGLKQTQVSKAEQFKQNISRTKRYGDSRIDDVFSECDKSLKLTIKLLKDDLGIGSSSLLPSQTVLVPIATYFRKKRLDSLEALSQTDRKRIINWFILSSFNGYYSSRTDTKLDRDLEAIDGQGGFPWDSLMQNMSRNKAKTKIDFGDIERGMYSNILRRQGRAHLFLLYVNLVKSNADDWSGVLLKSRDYSKLARHHIFPKEFLDSNLNLDEPDASDVMISNLGNITFINKDVNSEIEDSPPEEYMPQYIEAAKKHFVPMERNLWTLDQYNTFLEYRVRQVHSCSKALFPDIVE
ncbi:MAG: DUF262 domain-containing protein [Methanotrichaceae archaeon]|nr:DUF262 domain-containing protein [Methanotrichaceae archaeon]